MSEHTPGPWTIELTGDESSKDKLIIGHPNATDFNRIRSVGRLWAYGTEQENAANASLIAAAPDLLEACKEQHEAIDILFALLISKVEGFFPSKSGKPWEAILKGKAAIAQAKGES